jgi:hypothetical protein
LLKFSNKITAEIVDVGMDFRALLSATGAISNPVWGVTVISGSDAAPSGLLEGTTAVQGTTAFARLHGGTAGVTYKVRCEVDADSGEHFVGDSQILVTA